MLTKIIEFGDDLAISLPDEILAKLNVGVGDSIWATQVEDGLLISSKKQITDI